MPSSTGAVEAGGDAWLAPGFAFALAKLAGAGAGVALFVRGAQKGALYEPLLRDNSQDPLSRKIDLVAVLACAALPVLAALAYGAWRRARGRAAVERAGDLFGPLLVAGTLPALTQLGAWNGAPISMLALLAASVLVLEQLLGPSLAALGSSFGRAPEAVATWSRVKVDRVALGVVIAASVAFTAWGIYYTLLAHRRFATSAFDLGIYDNLMYNALTGHPFRSPVLFGPQGGNYIAGHAEYAMLLALPVYAIAPGSQTLLVLQAMLLGLAPIPLYLFARTQIAPVWAALVAVSYLLFAPLHGPLFYDFHWLPLAIFFHFCLYWAIASRRDAVACAMLVVLFLIREDVAVGIAVLGTFLVLVGHRPRFGASVAATAVAWFVVDKFVLMPWAGSWWFADMYKELIPKGESGYGAVVKTMLVNPTYFLKTLVSEDKLRYSLHMFAPLAFLPLRRAALAFLAIPGFFFTLMTTGYAPTVSISFQYTTHWIPYLFAATVLSIAVASRASWSKGGAAALALAFGVAVHSFPFGAVMQHSSFVGGFQRVVFTMTAAEKKTYEGVVRLVSLVPRAASVAATDALVPHISARTTCYTLRDHHGDSDYLLVNSSTLGYGNTKKNLEDAVRRNPYGLFGREGDVYLLKKNHSSPEDAATFSRLGIHVRVP